MIEHLPPQEQAWLARFFANPNELRLVPLLDGSAAPQEADQFRQWLGLLGSHAAAPLILPLMRRDGHGLVCDDSRPAGWL